MKFLSPIFIILMIILACRHEQPCPKQNSSLVKQAPASDRPTDEKHTAIYTLSNDSLWNYLVNKKGSCLTGGQHVREGEFGSPECVMTNAKEWKIFFDRDRQELTRFLLSKLPDTLKTEVHTCPFFVATQGELAVYGLQNLYKTNWFDLGEFRVYKNRPAESATDNHQAWLQAMLLDEEKRNALAQAWRKKAGE